MRMIVAAVAFMAPSMAIPATAPTPNACVIAAMMKMPAVKEVVIESVEAKPETSNLFGGGQKNEFGIVSVEISVSVLGKKSKMKFACGFSDTPGLEKRPDALLIEIN